MPSAARRKVSAITGSAGFVCVAQGAQDEFVLAAIAQNLRRLAKLVVQLQGH
jgi:hypothetical protein